MVHTDTTSCWLGQQWHRKDYQHTFLAIYENKNVDMQEETHVKLIQEKWVVLTILGHCENLFGPLDFVVCLWCYHSDYTE